MPQKHIYLIITFFSLWNGILYSQNSDTYNCREIEYKELLDTSFTSFEKDIFAHYKFDTPLQSYKTFLKEVASLSLDLRKIPSAPSIQAARTFKKNAANKNALWVLLSTYDDVAHKDKAILPRKDKKGEDVLTFNYRGGFIQCLKNNSHSQGFKEIVSTLEADGNVSPSIIAQLLATLPDDEFDSFEVKNFIAFDIYYSILLIVEKAFPQ